MPKLILAWVTTVLLGGADAAAAEPGGAAPLTLRQAVTLVNERSPVLAAFETQRQATEARSQAFVLPPVLTVGTELENFAGSGDFSGTSALESTLSLSGVLELGGKRDARRETASAERHVLDAEQHARRLDLYTIVGRRFVDVVAAEEKVLLAREASALAAATRDAVQQRVAAARASAAERARAEVSLARTARDTRRAEHDLRASRVMLSSLWDAEDAELDVDGTQFFTLPAVRAFAEAATLVERNPDLELLSRSERLLDARTRLAQAAARTDVEWSFGVRRLQEPEDTALVLSLGVPLGGRARASLSEREAAALRTGAAHDGAAKKAELRATLFVAYEQLEDARFEVETLQRTSQVWATEALHLTESGYRTGRFSLIELADAQGALLDVRADTIEAAARFHRVLMEIERLTGESITVPKGSDPFGTTPADGERS